MKKILLLILSLTLLSTCSSSKKATKALNSGNYDNAITTAITKLRKNKSKKGNQTYILMLEEAYAKLVDRETKHILFLEKEGNPSNLETIFNSYSHLKTTQERIRPLLPLSIIEQNRKARFKFENYNSKIIQAKEKLTNHLYTSALNKMSSAFNNKHDYRSVYDDLIYLNKITPNYKNTKSLIKEAHFKGTDFVTVNLRNETNMIIPKRLESDLLDFDTYGLNNLWKVYHNKPQQSINYDYAMDITFRAIKISPEQVKETQLQKEKLVKDGTEFLKDDDGNVIKDEDGEKIEIDRMVTVKCDYYEFRQFKSVNVLGKIHYKDLKTNQLVKTFPLASEFVFEHIYANYNGDKRALESSLLNFLNARSVPFPNNEQMVYDCGETIKRDLKGIISRYNFQ